MSRFIETLSAARLDGTYVKWVNQIARTPLLILEDFGLNPLDHKIRLSLLDILEDRYGKHATIITSQLPVNKWHEYIGEVTLADYLNKIIMLIRIRIIVVNQFLALKY